MYFRYLYSGTSIIRIGKKKIRVTENIFLYKTQRVHLIILFIYIFTNKFIMYVGMYIVLKCLKK
jgi:hypothetical protein